jgi:transcriptional regulator with XRE-family HTH domain
MMQVSIKTQYPREICDTLAPMRACITLGPHTGAPPAKKTRVGSLPGAVTVALGDTIRELREARDMSQRELARRAGVNQPVLSRIESGETLNPRYETLRDIAEALNVPLTTLTGRPAPARGSAGQSPLLLVPIVRRPAHAGEDWTWEGTGQTVTVDEAAARGRNLIAITVEGRCMEPYLMDGDLVLVDLHDKALRDRTIVVLSTNSQTHVRWARLTRPGQPEFVDNNGARLLAPEITLEGVAYQIVRRNPRRPDWNDLIE